MNYAEKLKKVYNTSAAVYLCIKVSSTHQKYLISCWNSLSKLHLNLTLSPVKHSCSDRAIQLSFSPIWLEVNLSPTSLEIQNPPCAVFISPKKEYGKRKCLLQVIRVFVWKLASHKPKGSSTNCQNNWTNVNLRNLRYWIYYSKVM